MRFGDYQDELKAQFGNTSPDTTTVALMKRAINQAYEELVRKAPKAYWFRKSHTFNTIARTLDTDGADSVIGGERFITVSDFEAKRNMIGAVARVNEENETYTITDVQSITTLILDSPFTGAAVGTSLTNVQIELLGWNYIMPPDFISAYSVKISNNPLYINPAYQRFFDRIAPDPMILGQRGIPYHYFEAPGYNFPDFWGTNAINQVAIGSSPTAANIDLTFNTRIVQEGTNDPLFNDPLTKEDSTAVATNQSHMVGRHFKVAGEDRWYRIDTVAETSGGSGVFRILLDEPYQGSTVTDSDYQIDDGHAPIMRLYPIPETVMQVDVTYHAKPPILIVDDDEPRIPRDLHTVITDGALYFFSRYMGDAKRREEYRRDFDRGLMDVRKHAEPTSDNRYRFEMVPELSRRGLLPNRGTFPPEIEV